MSNREAALKEPSFAMSVNDPEATSPGYTYPQVNMVPKKDYDNLRACYQELLTELEQERKERVKWQRIRKPTHGPCCTCQRCGLDYDSCRCDLDEVADELAQAKQRAESAEHRAQEAAAFIRKFMRWYPDCGQLLDGWHSDGTAWSDWDTTVRQGLTKLGDIACALVGICSVCGYGECRHENGEASCPNNPIAAAIRARAKEFAAGQAQAERVDVNLASSGSPTEQASSANPTESVAATTTTVIAPDGKMPNAAGQTEPVDNARIIEKLKLLRHACLNLPDFQWLCVTMIDAEIERRKQLSAGK